MKTRPILQSPRRALAMLLLSSSLSVASIAQEIDAPIEKIFDGVKGTTIPSQAVVIRNTGTSPLQISSVAKTGTNAGSFTLVNPPSTPRTVAAGGSVTYTVSFTPGQTVGALSAALTITSNDTDEATLNVGLYGLSTQGLEGDKEPTLNNVCKTLGYNIDVGGTGLLLGTGPGAIGDEVLKPLFVKAGPGVVTMTPVARYSPKDPLDFGYYTRSGSTITRQKVATIKGDDNQELNPALTTTDAPTFDPGTATFGFYSGPAPHYANYNNYTEDSLNVSPAPLPHAMRIYPLKNRSGQLVANSYLVCMEPAKNGDYQDYVFVVSNVRPPSAVVANGTYRFIVAHSSKGLTVRNSLMDTAPLEQRTYTGTFNQRWQVTAVSGGYYKIVAAHSGKALSVPDSSNENIQVTQQTYEGSDNQLWKFDAIGGNFRVVAKHSGKALDVSGKSQTDGAPVIQYTAGTGANQQWKLSAP